LADASGSQAGSGGAQGNHGRSHSDQGDNQPSARGRGNTTFDINIAPNASHGHFWLWSLFVLGLLYILRRLGFFGALVIPWKDIFTLVVPILLLVFIIWGFYSGIKNKEDVRVWVALALLIWLVDIVPMDWLLGPTWLSRPYQGFFIDWQGIANVSIFAIATSGISFAFLYVNMVMDIIKKEYIAFLSAFFFIVIFNSLVAHYFPSTLAYNIKIPKWQAVYFGLAVLGLIAFFLVRWLGSRVDNAGQQLGNFASYMFMAFVFSFFWTNDGWMFNIKALVHAFYIVAFGFFYMRRQEEDNPIVWHLLIPCLLIFDFFGAGLLWSTNYLVLKFIPMLVLFVLTYCYVKTEDGYSLISFIGIVTIMLILSVQAYGYEPQGNVQFNARDGQQTRNFLDTLWQGIVSKTTDKLDEASGGYFKSKVEKNQYEALGVYFSGVRASQPVFYDDEPVTLWATIKSRTLSDPVAVSFNCSRWKEGVKIGPILDKDPKDYVFPPAAFTVFTFEDTDAECTFNQNSKNKKLDVGDNTMTLSATYNFDTSAYQKLYFIDRERLRTLTRENINPLQEFGITEMEPPTIHTNGPVELAISTQYLISVADGEAVNLPNLGILLKNRNMISDKEGKPIGQWTGRIKKINELVIVVPSGITIEKPAECRPAAFEPVDQATLCTATNWCGQCANTCSQERDVQGCIRLCTATCIEECNSVFKDDGNPATSGSGISYSAYRMKTETLYQDNDDYIDIDQNRHKTFGCRIKVTSSILENTPITTKYIRALTRYEYTIDQSYVVKVQQAPASTLRTPMTYLPSNIDIDEYLKSKNSPLQGVGQCIRDTDKRTKIPASVILGVAVHESNWGKSGLAQQSKNLFGIKCTKSYVDNTCTFAIKSQCCRPYSKTGLDMQWEPDADNTYRVYQDWCESINNFANLISTTQRYSHTLQYASTPTVMLTKIRESGYASDPRWADSVSAIIRQFPSEVASSAATT
jgi:hypothetical protein